MQHCASTYTISILAHCKPILIHVTVCAEVESVIGANLQGKFTAWAGNINTYAKATAETVAVRNVLQCGTVSWKVCNLEKNTGKANCMHWLSLWVIYTGLYAVARFWCYTGIGVPCSHAGKQAGQGGPWCGQSVPVREVRQCVNACMNTVHVILWTNAC